MIYIAGFILGFTILQFLVAVSNYLFRNKLTENQINNDTMVSVLIPARNEQENIGNILNDLLSQNYQNIEIIIFNDQSTDKTTEIVRLFASESKKIRLINSDILPEGWSGKNYACYSLAKLAKGSYFLFLDADVRLGKEIIQKTLSYTEKYKFGLVSIFPKQLMLSAGEKMTVPVMNFILLTLLPLALVSKTKNYSLSAANGQFMLFNASDYNTMCPHETFHNHKVEDIAIARYFKKNNIKVDCLVGDEGISCRMYKGLNEAVIGFSKNFTAFFGNSFLLAILFWMISSFGFVFILLSLPVAWFILYIAINLITRIIVSITSRQNVFENMIFLIPQQFATGLFIYKALINKILKKGQWKGRSI